ncbi:hypothetical protein C9I57_12915 [Trinickia symbiotica]|uniref:Class I SAM-dependent methyltransferase n=1 Tax=Trinickia symbiotica TaxID=863227 RepID=A0A2T3XW25_9BURK|nr:class I SAM-dependent methyltransferase [Trinickia symbiotica]PTB20714.1 hypothetical protein C9I57_12915 [Trinickia symbiotica]
MTPNSIQQLIEKYPEVKKLVEERDQYFRELQSYCPNVPTLGRIPPGHFYSPIPSLDEVRHDTVRLFDMSKKEMPGVDLKEQEQRKLLDLFSERYYDEIPFHESKEENLRYWFDNPMFSYGDAISLYCMIRDLAPHRIVEIGSGFSSAVMLDINDLCFDGKIETTFIEPNNERLLSLLKESDRENCEIIRARVQDVDLATFYELNANDILFIDSSHTSKIGSDVNTIFFDILPSLRPGVHVHFHDIFLPFEYPSEWIYQGIAWNEAYVLRAFLQFNRAFEVVLMNAFMGSVHAPFLSAKMPLFMRNIGGSFWLKRVR